jgi:hypothetical protein
MKAFARYVGIDYSGAQTPGKAVEPRALRVRIEPRISMTPTASRGGFQAPTMTGRCWGFLKPSLDPSERTRAQVEGWILGVA